jgi:hypothetical protein
MKYIAFLEQRYDSEIITINDVFKKRAKKPEKWEKRRFYALGNLAPMFARFPQKRQMSFCYVNALHGNGNANGGEGITHSLAKSILFNEKKLNIFYYKKKYDILLKNPQQEWRFTSKSGKDYYIDLVAEIAKPDFLIEEFNSRIGIEIKVTHAVDMTKKYAMRENKFGSIEIEIPKRFHVKNDAYISSQQVEKIHSELKQFFTTRIYVSSIHNPNYRNYCKNT